MSEQFEISDAVVEANEPITSNSETLGDPISNGVSSDEQEDYEPQAPDISDEEPIVESNEQPTNEESDDDYNPEEFGGNEPDSDIKPVVTEAESADSEHNVEESEEEDDEDILFREGYDPSDFEGDVVDSHGDIEAHALPAHLTILPQKPPSVVESDQNQDIIVGFSQLINSDMIKDPSFQDLSPEKQMRKMLEFLAAKNINLWNSKTINFDQVKSYNKPFKNVKNPIPLIPVNPFCKRPDITIPPTTEDIKDFDDFVNREKYYNDLAEWDQFPLGSRMFIGNLPANTASKQDLFRIFNAYGEVIQISIKAGFGFVQFRTTEQCSDAIKGETNVPLHNKVMHLESSRPQLTKPKNPGHYENQSNSIGARPSRVESYRERVPEDPRTARRRSRSPRAGRGARQPNRGNEGSPSYSGNRRSSKDVPDCQVYSTDRSSAFFARQVVKGLNSANIETELSDATHQDIRNLISEAAYAGVLGVCIINERDVDVQVFEHTADGGVKFDEYLKIEPKVATDLLTRAKAKKYPNNSSYGSQQSASISYGTSYSPRASNAYPQQSSYGQQQSYGSQQQAYGSQQQAYGGQQYGQQYSQSSYQPPQQSQSSSYIPNQYQQQNASLGSSYVPQQHQAPVQPAPVPSQNNLLQTLQNMDPAQMQNMLSLLQSQNQNQSPPQQQQQQAYQVYQQAPPPPSQQPASNSGLSNLLSQLQQPQVPQQPTFGGYGSPAVSNLPQSRAPPQQQAPAPQQQQQQQQSAPSFNLMDTLARLGGKK